ncbi:hypothetical protein ACFL35_21265 [Candidatus Riflebacteria bacterium]
MAGTRYQNLHELRGLLAADGSPVIKVVSFNHPSLLLASAAGEDPKKRELILYNQESNEPEGAGVEWELISDPHELGFFSLKNCKSGLYMDLLEAEDSAFIYCTTARNCHSQKWTVRLVAPDRKTCFAIRNKCSSYHKENSKPLFLDIHKEFSAGKQLIVYEDGWRAEGAQWVFETA